MLSEIRQALANIFAQKSRVTIGPGFYASTLRSAAE